MVHVLLGGVSMYLNKELKNGKTVQRGIYSTVVPQREKQG